jgi:hypothetical protein
VALAVLAAAYGLGYTSGQRTAETRATQAETQAFEAEGRADVHAKQARAADEAADKDAALKAGADAEAARLRSVVATLRAQTPVAVLPAHVADAPIERPAPSTLEQAKDELIEAQERRAQADNRLIQSLTAARDAYKARSEALAEESLNLRAALEAQKGLVKAAELKGFLRGFAYGGALGAVGGGVAVWRIK